jgi:glycyl-tRNA synthetase beta chain
MTGRTPGRASANLLVEIGTEELPPKALSHLGRTLADSCRQNLAEVNLLDDTKTAHRWFASPRRLAVWIPAVRGKQPDQRIERRGPSVSAAFDGDGHPTKAALGFARSCGVEIEQLQRAQDAKGNWLVHRSVQRGRTASMLIPQCVERAIKQLPIPKRMRWGDGSAEFVRPVHWLVIMHGRSVIKTNLLSVDSGAYTRGHRFHCPHRLRLASADDYEKVLTDNGFVIPDFDNRRRIIQQKVQALAKRVDGIPLMDDALLDEVTGLVEWPIPMRGEFDKIFLKVPQEALVSSMRDHQKYFPIKSRRGRLLPYFITVSNIKSKNPKRVREGNERVLRARLADARFFWETDRNTPLGSRVDALKDVLFHNKLGSLFDKTSRVRTLSALIAELLGVNVAHCERAALLAKADLVTDMVGEFPELQGTMGKYYAGDDGEHKSVATAIEEHYRPRFAGDLLPRERVGQVVAIADKLDSLVGIFAAGEEPTGDKDPFGLRRAALGILRILIEKKLDLDLLSLIEESARILRDQLQSIAVPDKVVAHVFEFVLERTRALYGAAGFQLDELNAVITTRPVSPLDFDRRLRAVAKFRKLPQAENLAAANKRIRNILRKSSEPIPDHVDQNSLTEIAEQQLFQALERLTREVSGYFRDGEYDHGLKKLVSLKEPVDHFFDEVLVMTEDVSLRQNRLALLRQIQELFLQTADISKLQVDAG